MANTFKMSEKQRQTVDRTIFENFRLIAAEIPDRVAVHQRCKGVYKTYTYAQILETATAYAQVLEKAGVAAGDRVVLISESKAAWVIAYMAASIIKTTLVLLDASLSPEEISILVENSDVRCILASSGVFAKIENNVVYDAIPFLNIDDSFRAFPGRKDKVADDYPPTPDPDPNAAIIIYSSGTTGMPKGVVLSHRGLILTVWRGINTYEIRENDRFLSIVPLNHIFGYCCCFLASLYGRGTLCFLDELRGDVLAEGFKVFRPTLMPTVPRLFELLYDKITGQVRAKGPAFVALFRVLTFIGRQSRNRLGLDVSRKLFGSVHESLGGEIRTFLLGGSPLDQNIQRLFDSLGFNVYEAYGLTEVSMAVCGNFRGHNYPGTVGVPFDDIEVKIANPDSAGIGEIMVKSSSVMIGYFRNKEATDNIIREGGWLATGDLGHVDHRFNLTITGRIKELIVLPSGKKCDPSDVEYHYKGLVGVMELAVVGVMGADRRGDEIHACIIVDPSKWAGSSMAEIQSQIEENIARMSAKLPAHLKIQKIHFINHIPKSSALKVKRGDLRQMILSEGKEEDVLQRVAKADGAVSGEGVEAQIISILNEILTGKTGNTKISGNSTLQFDLGLDSLDYIELCAQIENRFDVVVSDVIKSVLNVSQLVDIVRLQIHESAGAPRNARTPLQIAIPKARNFGINLMYRTFVLASRVIWKNVVQGVENIPREGAFILCPNHESNLDSFWVSSFLPSKISRNMCLIGKKELFDNRVTRFFSQMLGGMPVDRDGDPTPAMDACRKAIECGKALLIHPEGTRSKTGVLHAFRRGAAKLALEMQVPLIPVRLVGVHEVYPPHKSLPSLFDRKRFKRHKIEVRFGEPIFPAEFAAIEQSEACLTERLRESIIRLAAREQE